MRVSIVSSIGFTFLLFCGTANAQDPIACVTELQATLQSTISTHSHSDYQIAKNKLAPVTQPAEFLNRSYTLPEALAMVERHIELTAPDLAPQIKSWNAELFKTHDGAKIKSIEDESLSGAAFKKRLFRADVAKWPVQVVKNPADLFKVQQNALNLLTQSRFKSIAGYKVLTEGPGRYIVKNVRTRAENLGMQYWLGRDQIQGSVLNSAGRESFTLMSNLLFGMGRGKDELNALHKWIFENYGMRGLSNYIAAKYGTIASLRYLTNISVKVSAVALTVLGAEVYKKIRRMIREQFKTEPALQVKEEDQKDATQIVKQMNYSPEELKQLNEKAMKKTAPSLLDFDRTPATDLGPKNDKELNDLNQAVQREMDSIRHAKVRK